VAARDHPLLGPVSDLYRSRAWYQSRLGYQVQMEFVEHDPDGHEVRFYTLQHHTEPNPGAVLVVCDPRERAERHEGALAEQS